MKKFLSLLLVCLMVVPFGILATTGVSAAGEVWDGKTGDLGWYLKDTNAAEFEIKNGEELYGLSILLAHEPKASIKGDGKIYYDDNNKIILDADKITETTKNTARTQLNGKLVKLTADIDLGNHPFLPIGSTGSIKANFDGQNHTVKNLYVNAETAKHRAQQRQYYYGLFAYIAINVEVRNVKVEHAVFDIDIPEADAVNPYIYCGGLVGAIHSDTSHIKDCSVNDFTINFKPHATYAPMVDATSGKLSTMIGAAVGRLGNGVGQENITVTNFVFNDTLNNPENYNHHESWIYGGQPGNTTHMPHFPNSSVTLKDGTKYTAPVLDLGDDDEDEEPSGETTKKPQTTTKPAATDKATDKADATTAAPQTEAPQNNTTLIIIIAGVAAAIVIAVVVIVVIKKKSAQ